MNKVILITGSSRGIGAATALLAAELGYDVCINYRENKNAAVSIVQQIQAMGRKSIAVSADVSDEEQVEKLFAEIDEKLGPITALINNAGIVPPSARIVDMDAQRLEHTLITNISSYFLCAKQALLRMSTKHGGKGGAIVNVSSAASRLGSANEYVDYAASKGAIDSFTIGLAKEVAGEQVRVNCVRPGFIHTEIHHDINRINNLKDKIPLHRGGEPKEVAETIMWFLSEKTSYVTGAFLDVAGGC